MPEDVTNPEERRRVRAIPLLLIILIGVGTLVLYAVSGFPSGPRHHIEITTYFDEADGLRQGAPVRVAGVELGSVRSIRVRAERDDEPVEVKLGLRFDYDLQIPSDATAKLATAGVLGETFVDIDIRGTSGPPIQNGGVLKSADSERFSWKEAQQLLETLSRIPCPERAEILREAMRDGKQP